MGFKSTEIKTKECNNCNSFFLDREKHYFFKEDSNLCLLCMFDEIYKGRFLELDERKVKELKKHLDKDRSKASKSNSESIVSNYPQVSPAKRKVEFGRNLNEIVAKKNDEVFVSREDKIKEIITVLSRKDKGNPLVVGSPGVGKTSLIREIARRINSKNVPDKLQNKIIVEVTPGELISGTSLRGQFEERVRGMINQFLKDDDLILFIDEFEQFVDLNNNDGTVNVMGMLKPYLSDGRLRLIGVTTEEGYNSKIASDQSIARRLQRIMIDEPNFEQTLLITKEKKIELERYHKVKISEEVLEETIKLTNQFVPQLKQPDKTIDILDEASAVKTSSKKNNIKSILQKRKELNELFDNRLNLIKEKKYIEAQKTVEKEEVIKERLKELSAKSEVENIEELDISFVKDVITKRTGIPILQKINSRDSIEEKLRYWVKGQDEAISEVSKFIRRSQHKLGDPKRPDGVFLFLGPTGVGKTELAKAISEEIYGGKIIRFDMSEFSKEGSESKLLGSPPSYVGYEDGARLIDELRIEPHSVVLLDEIEKAHPKVLNIFLQVFDDGIITDNKGNTIDVKNAIFIMTSNAGVRELSKKRLGFSNVDRRKSSGDILNSTIDDGTFTPEFLNRIDAKILFNDLDGEVMFEIVEGMVSRLVERFKDRGYQLTVSEKVIKKIANSGYDKNTGARGVKREVENLTDIALEKISDLNSVKLKLDLDKDENIFCLALEEEEEEEEEELS